MKWILSTLFIFSVLFSQAQNSIRPDHIVVCILENHAYSQIIGSSAAPYINSLVNDSYGALFTQSFAIEHPSQPNYLDLYSGANQGVTDDNVPPSNPFTTPNLGAQLIAAGRSFRTYSEDLPSVGYNGATSTNYARKHNPAANWMGTGTNQIPAGTNQPFTSFPTNFATLPTISYVVPNQNNDMHNGSDPARITAGDTWVQTNMASYIAWCKTHNSLFILTFDEDDDAHANRIVTIFIGSDVAHATYASPTINHYSLLRMMEDMYGLSYATSNVSSATPVTGVWNTSLPTTADVFMSQTEMTVTVAGDPYDEFYWFDASNTTLTKTNVNFQVAGSYRCDVSGYQVAGSPQFGILIDGVQQGTITITSPAIGISSVYLTGITAGTHTVAIKLNNFSSGTNHGRIGLLYFTNTTQTTPYTYPTITDVPLKAGQLLVANSYGSGHLRGFNLGSNGTNAAGETQQSMLDMRATRANIARAFIEIERLSGDTYTFKTGEIAKLDTTVARAARMGFYVVPCIFLDPAFNTDYWGNAARKTSIATLWKTLAAKYRTNTFVGGYDLINEPRQNFNYAEVIRFEQQMVDSIHTIDADHVVMVEPIENDMFAMMLPLYQYNNVVYSPHGYSTLLITHQGVTGESAANVRNIYPHTVTTSNLAAPWGITQLSVQHDNVRIMSHRFNIPVFIGEFSCINWSPTSAGVWGWTSTQWSADNISLLEAEGWSWAYHAWRGDYPGWESEIPSSYYNSFSFVNATPQSLPSYNTWVSNRSNTAPTIVMLEGLFALNGTTFYISNAGNDANDGLTPATAWKTLKSFVYGNTYLFHRGETYFYTIPQGTGTGAVNNRIRVGAYGTGAKPIFSVYSTINAGAWSQFLPNIWRVNITTAANVTGFLPTLANCGFIKVGGVIHGVRLSAQSMLNAQWEFYCDFTTNFLYVYSQGVSPATFGTIQVSNDNEIINVGNYETVDSVTITGTARPGFLIQQPINDTLRYVTVTETGGQMKSAVDSTRQGAGIGFDQGSTNTCVEYCHVDNCYECAYTLQTHSGGVTPGQYKNTTFRYDTSINCESSFNGSIAVTGAPAFNNDSVYGCYFTQEGSSWSHPPNGKPVDNQAVTLLNNFSNGAAADTTLYIVNNTFYDPLEGVYFVSGSDTTLPYISKNNDIWVRQAMYIRKNPVGGGIKWAWTYNQGGGYTDFVAQSLAEQGSTWHCIDCPVPTDQGQDPNDYMWFNQ